MESFESILPSDPVQQNVVLKRTIGVLKQKLSQESEQRRAAEAQLAQRGPAATDAALSGAQAEVGRLAGQVRILQQRVQQSQAREEALNRQLQERLSRDADALEHESSNPGDPTLQEEVQMLRSDQATAIARFNALRAEYDSLRQRYETMRASNARMSARYEQQVAELEAQRLELTGLRQEAATAQSLRKELEDAHAQSQARQEEADAGMTSLREQCASLRDEASKAAAVIASLDSEVVSLGRALSDEAIEDGRCLRALGSSSADPDSAGDDAEAWESALAPSAGASATTNESRAGIDRSPAELAHTLLDRVAAISALQRRSSRLRRDTRARAQREARDREALQSSLTMAEADYRRRLREIEEAGQVAARSAAAEASQLRANASQLQAQVAAAQQQMSRLAMQREQVAAQLASAQESARRAEDDWHKRLEEEREASAGLRETFEARVGELSDALAEQVSCMEEVKSRASERSEASSRELEKARCDKDELEARLRDAQKRCSKLREELAAANEKLAASDRRGASLEAELARCREELSACEARQTHLGTQNTDNSDIFSPDPGSSSEATGQATDQTAGRANQLPSYRHTSNSSLSLLGTSPTVSQIRSGSMGPRASRDPALEDDGGLGHLRADRGTYVLTRTGLQLDALAAPGVPPDSATALTEPTEPTYSFQTQGSTVLVQSGLDNASQVGSVTTTLRPPSSQDRPASRKIIPGLQPLDHDGELAADTDTLPVSGPLSSSMPAQPRRGPAVSTTAPATDVAGTPQVLRDPVGAMMPLSPFRYAVQNPYKLIVSLTVDELALQCDNLVASTLFNKIFMTVYFWTFQPIVGSTISLVLANSGVQRPAAGPVVEARGYELECDTAFLEYVLTQVVHVELYGMAPNRVVELLGDGDVIFRDLAAPGSTAAKLLCNCVGRERKVVATCQVAIQLSEPLRYVHVG